MTEASIGPTAAPGASGKGRMATFPFGAYVVAAVNNGRL